jgi:plasmid stabilization system protein ParE
MPEPRIEKTVLATQDIEELAAYYQAEAGIAVALRFIDNAERAFEYLAQMPRMGAFLGFLHAPQAGIRRWHIKGFPRLLILYCDLPDGHAVCGPRLHDHHGANCHKQGIARGVWDSRPQKWQLRSAFANKLQLCWGKFGENIGNVSPTRYKYDAGQKLPKTLLFVGLQRVCDVNPM